MERIATIPVIASRYVEFTVELDKLVKKAKRYGNPDISFEPGEIRMGKITVRDPSARYGFRTIETRVVDVIVTGEAPRIGDYEFLARIDFDAKGNYVNVRPGADEIIDPKWFKTDNHCDHCGYDRQRNQVYIVRNLKTGEQVQVGRTCLRDYLGIDNPNAIAWRFAFFKEIRGLSELDIMERGTPDAWEVPLRSLLAITLSAIRNFGWVSKKQASFDPSLFPTAERVKEVLNGSKAESAQKILEDIQDADYRKADAVVEWVRNLDPEGKAYLHNLQVAFTDEFLTGYKNVALAVSAPAAYNREVENQRQNAAKRAVSKHIGTVKERLRALPVTQTFRRPYHSGTIYKFEDAQGNVLTWFCKSYGTSAENGDKLVIDATVLDHGEYNGVKQTVISHVKVKDRVGA